MTDILRQELPHSAVPALAMPIGGIGTGGFAVGADGSLRQWQLHGMPNHVGALPGTGFWLRVTQIEPPLDVVSMVQGHPVDDPGASLTTDAVVPEWMSAAADRFGTFASARFSGTYPIAEVGLSDPRHPVAVTMRALNPMVPGDVETSGMPSGLFSFTLTNTGEFPVHGTLAGSLLNAAGWDGITPIGEHTPGLGGNVNRLLRGRGWSRVVMDNPSIDESDQLAGQLVLAADDPSAAVLARCTGVEHLRAFLDSRALNDGRSRLEVAPTVGDPQLNAPRGGSGASAPGRSWLGVVGVPYWLEPGQSRTIRFSMSWHFPNRFVDIEQFGRPHPEAGASRFYLGNGYGQRYRDALDVQAEVEERWDDLVARTSRWTETLTTSSLAPREADYLAAQAAYVRSPTCFIGADGRFYGYEGSLGASTWMWSGVFGGSCPLNCTHVWQYEAALAGLWPELERDMRDTEFDVMQAPNGAIPHRLRVPTYLPQMTHEMIGGPEEPALDGMLATILKSLRDVQRGAGAEWLERRWPSLQRLYRHIAEKWDADGDGVLHGIQPSTHDIDLAGVNPFMGTLWLAALRAYEELALLAGDDDAAAEARARFESGSRGYDEAIFDGTHYIQRLDEGDPTDFQWLTGILSDQVIGQWWAHQLGLGHILPAEHVRSALRHVVGSNLRHGFADFTHPYRVYADTADDVGLLMCSWPDGGRPEVPTRYADEVWTGIEAQVAAHCLFEGLDDAGQAVLDGLWNRHDGSRRNPYNEIECGDHYARAMAGWTLLQARSGVRVDEATGSLHVGANGRWPWVASTGYGTVVVTDDDVAVEIAEGAFGLEVVRA
ncbi:GH116 family glycosyl-hydrolase [Agromyces sp. H3Y2-19a]|uniref:GH116 family glycosyl-hydrolase n=1 Tax=Agromyces chromiiresistens TaxID=3030835 RepID=UPI0023B9A52B|nr:GH116 family glycosyl-hydrolase [Agromyces chromiiresistens]MDF0513713.1 GH116 family glycosyl-hydrolase [Agromyces chromiiresistens]